MKCNISTLMKKLLKSSDVKEENNCEKQTGITVLLYLNITIYINVSKSK